MYKQCYHLKVVYVKLLMGNEYYFKSNVQWTLYTCTNWNSGTLIMCPRVCKFQKLFIGYILAIVYSINQAPFVYKVVLIIISMLYNLPLRFSDACRISVTECATCFESANNRLLFSEFGFWIVWWEEKSV